MRYSLLLIIVCVSLIVNGQSNFKYKYLINSWTQGKLDKSEKVIKADVNRGGWYSLILNKDLTTTFGDPVSCGFGSERQGNYSINKKEKTITFAFTKKVGYVSAPGTTDINETEVYKILRLKKEELILEKIDQSKKFIYLPTSKTQD
jgi:hypothetical protein